MKKRLPRLTSLAVVLLILVCAFPAYASKTKLQVIHRAVIHEEWVQRHLEGFYAENPDIEVEFIWIPTGEYLQKLQVLFASGTIGDLVEMNPSYNYGYFAKEGLWTDRNRSSPKMVLISHLSTQRPWMPRGLTARST